MASKLRVLENIKKPIGLLKYDVKVNEFIHRFQSEYKLQNKEDWEKITQDQIITFGGGKNVLLNYTLSDLQNIGLSKLRSTVVKPRKKVGHWQQLDNVEKFMENIKIKYNLNTIDDWKQIKQKHIVEEGGSRLLTIYSMQALKVIGCPELDKIEKKQKKNQIPYSEKENWKKLNDENTLPIEKYSILYSLSKQNKNLQKYDVKPYGFWNNDENIKIFLDFLKIELNLNHLEDWDKLTQKQIKFYGGSALLSKYSLYEIKCLGNSNFSKYKENNKKSIGFWGKKENIFALINKLKDNFQLKTINDWEKLSKKQIISITGESLFSKFSLFEIKSFGCPDINKKKKSNGFWSNRENIKLFFDKLKKFYKLETKEDWYRISTIQIKALGGRRLLTYYSLHELLNIVFPDENWDKQKLIKIDKRSSQRYLFLSIENIFSKDEEIIEDYFHEEITRISGFPVQFDIFIPNKKIAFEYHGKHHFEEIPQLFSGLENSISRDNEKAKLCEKFGISLIIIPYWWNNSIDSLKQTIKSEIPDIIL